MFCTVIGVYFSKIILKNNYYKDNSDPSEIVIDEFAGFFVALFFVEINLVNIVICFFMFRFFDILNLAGIFAGILSSLIIANTALAQTGGLAIDEFRLASNNINRGKLAFIYEKSNTSNIYYIDFKTQEIRPLVNNSEKKSCPSWNSDGSKLAYTANGDKLTVLNISDYSKKKFSNLNCADWSKKSDKLVASYKNTLQIVNINNDKIDRVYAAKKTSKKTKKIYNPKFSPRGDEIIFSTDEYWPGSDLELYNLKTKKTFTLTSGYQNFIQASWHPSGGSFISAYGSKDDIDVWEYSKGMKHPEILFQRKGKDSYPIWRDDGEVVFFSGEIKNKTSQLFCWIKSQGKIFQLTNARGSIMELSWNPI